MRPSPLSSGFPLRLAQLARRPQLPQLPQLPQWLPVARMAPAALALWSALWSGMALASSAPPAEADRTAAVAAPRLAPSPAPAASTATVPLSFEEARARMHRVSDKLAAAQAAADSARLQAQSLHSLGGPVVSLSAGATRYHLATDIDTSGARQAIAQQVQQWSHTLPVPLPALTPLLHTALAGLPDSVPLHARGTRYGQSINVFWPIYTGGRLAAIRDVSQARHSEADADRQMAAHDLDTLLVQRYFTARLAQQAAALRQQAVHTIAQHDHAASRLLDYGMVARVERLQARVALEDARRQALKAQGDAQLADVALQRLLNHPTPIRPDSLLFVHSQPIGSLEYFQQLAQQHHPGLQKVAAKTAQAEHLHEASHAGWKPTITAYGRMGRSHGSPHTNWAAGVQASWVLWSAWDRRDMAAASQQRLLQVRHTDAQIRSDIALLVEKNWHQLQDARQQFLALQPGLELAHEVLRLRQAGLRAGTSTTMDLIDAQTNLTKVETERAQAAHAYVQALAQLLHSAGVPERFAHYMQQADIQLPPPGPEATPRTTAADPDPAATGPSALRHRKAPAQRTDGRPHQPSGRQDAAHRPATPSRPQTRPLATDTGHHAS